MTTFFACLTGTPRFADADSWWDDETGELELAADGLATT